MTSSEIVADVANFLNSFTYSEDPTNNDYEKGKERKYQHNSFNSTVYI